MPSETPSDMSPAELAISRFGGHAELAKAIGRDVSRIHRWTYPASRGGTDGQIPGSALRCILEAAQRAGIQLSADELLRSTPKPKKRRAAA